MATDGSQRASKTLVSAARILSPTERVVDVLYVIPKAPHHPSPPERILRRAHIILDRTKALLAAEGVQADVVYRIGSPSQTIIGASHNYDVTVVAATSHREGPMSGLGPVASRVAEHASGAVLLAREGANETGTRILVAIDGSESSLHALDSIVQLLDLTEAEVTLLHIVESPWLHPGPDQEWLGYEEEEQEQVDPQAQLRQTLLDEGENILQLASRRLPAHVTVTTITREGLPADEILSEAESGPYDLVVVGATGSADMKHKILGSVSSKVAWNATCSVLLTSTAGEAVS